MGATGSFLQQSPEMVTFKPQKCHSSEREDGYRGAWFWPGHCWEADEAIQARDDGGLCIISSSMVKRNEDSRDIKEVESLTL